jgi:preprotein translocase subunit SecA
MEYKSESFELFQEMMERIQDRVVKYPLEARSRLRAGKPAPPPRFSLLRDAAAAV